jgi:hypothetical protein
MYVPASSKQDIPVYWPADKVGLTVEVAIIARTVPEVEAADADYHAAVWVGTSGTATVKVGAAPFLLTAGEYVIWSRLTDGTNTPVRRAGTLTVGPTPTP